MDSFGVAPDRLRAVHLDHAIREGLADNLSAIFESLGHLGAKERLAAMLDRVRARPVAPAIFGTYIELVLALFGTPIERDRVARSWPSLAPGIKDVHVWQARELPRNAMGKLDRQEITARVVKLRKRFGTTAGGGLGAVIRGRDTRP